MIKVLFSPSESKLTGGGGAPLSQKSFTFPELYEKRLEVIQKYRDFLATAPLEAKQKLFGLKGEKAIEKFSTDIFKAPTMKAMERYTGVAYEYLCYETLSDREKAYTDQNVMLFSNLFGPLLGGDLVPDYKLKQGESIAGFKPEVFYKAHFSDMLDNWLQNSDVLDLRAGFYEKFYTLKQPYFTMKFIKEGKVVSHWAKAYRGLFLRALLESNCQNMEEFLKMPVNGLKLIEVKELRLKKEILFTII